MFDLGGFLFYNISLLVVLSLHIPMIINKLNHIKSIFLIFLTKHNRLKKIKMLIIGGWC
jgi:hypothetical protein